MGAAASVDRGGVSAQVGGSAGYFTRIPGCAPGCGSSRKSPGIGLFVGVAGGKHHAFADAELHLARREVRDQHRETSDQILRLVGRLDAREDGALAPFAGIERQLQQLVAALDVRRGDDLRDAEVELRKVVDRDGVGNGGSARQRHGDSPPRQAARTGRRSAWFPRESSGVCRGRCGQVWPLDPTTQTVDPCQKVRVRRVRPSQAGLGPGRSTGLRTRVHTLEHTS